MSQPRSFIELYNKFQNVYERLTNGRRDMKNFHDLLQSMQATEDRYHKDIDAGLRKQQQPILNTSLTAMYNEVKNVFSQSSKFHQGILVTTYKDLIQQLDIMIKEIKTTKTRLLDQYTKLVKEVDQKKAIHAKAKKTYDDSVEKAENAVANFRSGRSQVGNDKQVKKLEEAMHSASKELEKNHAAYLKAVRECQVTQKKYEEDTEQLLIQFEDLEKKRLATYQAIMNRFVDVQSQHKQEMTAWFESLNTTFQSVNPPKDILDFILDTYDGKPLEAHVFYEPKNSDVIPHYGDIGISHESQDHLSKIQANHARLMCNSTMKPHTYNIQGTNAQPNNSLVAQPSFITPNQASTFSAGAAGAGVDTPQTNNAIPTAADSSTASSGNVQQPHLRCTALYDFVGQEQGDLSFVTGQIIDLIQHEASEDWWFGTINGVSGAFPKTYVSAPFEVGNSPAVPSTAPSAAPVAASAAASPAADEALPKNVLKLVTALYDFQPESSDELKLTANEVYAVYAVVEDWYEGALYKDNQIVGPQGIFPCTFTQDQ